MKKISNFLLLLVVTIISLVICELIIRKVFPARVYKDERNLTYNHDSDLGWFPKKNSTMQYEGSRLINVRHNSLGFRDIEPQENKKPNIVFLGDSFVWGYDVEEDERLTENLRSKIGDKFNILNFGVSGYGTDQEFLLLQKYYDKFKPKIVFVIFCNNDFYNNSYNVVYHGYYKPYFEVENGKLTLKGSPVALSTNYKMLNFDQNHPILAKSHLIKWSARLIGKIEYKLIQKTFDDPTTEIFAAMNQFLEERGSKLIVGTIDHQPELEKFFNEKQISYINLQNEDRYPSHGQHWNPEGHRKAADQIFDLMKQRGYLSNKFIGS